MLELRAGSPRLDVHPEIDWHERDHLLKLAWPLDVHANDVTRHIQFGHLRPPIHTNTSWDAARFEVCAHHWIDVGEPGLRRRAAQRRPRTATTSPAPVGGRRDAPTTTCGSRC